jgi:hypothetical protein
MEAIANTADYARRHRRIAPLTVVLGAIFVFFCSALVLVFIATRRANPVMLDQQGKPMNSQSHPADGGTR